MLVPAVTVLLPYVPMSLLQSTLFLMAARELRPHQPPDTMPSLMQVMEISKLSNDRVRRLWSKVRWLTRDRRPSFPFHGLTAGAAQTNIRACRQWLTGRSTANASHGNLQAAAFRGLRRPFRDSMLSQRPLSDPAVSEKCSATIHFVREHREDVP
jgi:hypothetical protein